MLISANTTQATTYTARNFAPKGESTTVAVSADGFRPGQSSDAGLMPKSVAQAAGEAPKAEKETFWDRVGFCAGMGALVTPLAVGVAIPFIGLALAPVTIPLGALGGAIVGAFMGGGDEAKQA